MYNMESHDGQQCKESTRWRAMLDSNLKSLQNGRFVGQKCKQSTRWKARWTIVWKAMLNSSVSKSLQDGSPCWTIM